MYKREEIEKLVNSLDIVQVISEYVDLKKAGANYKGFSPFKEERTASFVVSPVKNIFTDFSTQQSGNVITFYMKINNLSFVEAIKELSEKYNIKIEDHVSEVKSKWFEENKKYFEIMEQAQTFFVDNIFKSEEALKYMKDRDFTEDDIIKYNIGFSPNKWRGLMEFLYEKGYSKNELLKLGLISENDNGTFDYFRNRIMFPIYNEFGQIVAFGGRKIDNTNSDSPKYLNSMETNIFKKSENLFGLERRAKNIVDKGFAILMEGYMDVLTAKKNDFTSSVASLGTAFTEGQANLLAKYTNNILIAYDNDEAGKNATLKAGMILQKKGFIIKCLVLNDKKDPDEYLRKYGKKQFFEQLKQSITFFDYLYKNFSEDLDLKDVTSKLNFIEKFKHFFSILQDETEVYLYTSKLALNLDIDKDVLYKRVLTFFKEGKYFEENKIKYNNDFKSKNSYSQNKYKKNYVENNYFEKNQIENIKKIDDSFEKNVLKAILYSKKNFSKKRKYFEFLVDKKINNDFYNGILEKLKKIDFDNKKIEDNLFTEEEKKEIIILNDFEVEIEENFEFEICYQWLRNKIDFFIKNLPNEKKILYLLELMRIFEKLKDNEYKTIEEIMEVNDKIDSYNLF